MQVTDIQQLTGKNTELIECETFGKGLHREVIAPFKQLQQAGLKQGFELAIVSGHRDFERQLMIWNEKACGKRAVVDDRGQRVELSELSPWQQVQAILRWSALPGASRHHWGTDIDVFDKASVDKGYSPELSVREVEGDGPFAAMHDWLDQQIITASSFGFFRPYPRDYGGVAPERWHLSYAPISARLQHSLTVERLRAALEDEPLLLKQTVLENLDEIFQRYINIPAAVYPEPYRSQFFPKM